MFVLFADFMLIPQEKDTTYSDKSKPNKADILRKMSKEYAKEEYKKKMKEKADDGIKAHILNQNPNIFNHFNNECKCKACKEDQQPTKNAYNKNYNMENEITILMEDFQELKQEYISLFGIGFRDESKTSKLESQIIEACLYNMYSLNKLLALHKDIIQHKKA